MIGIKDGKLVTEFCANRADPITSLNFKRAIASLFQVITENGEYVSTANIIFVSFCFGLNRNLIFYADNS
jgi:Lipoprotein amino terminal region